MKTFTVALLLMIGSCSGYYTLKARGRFDYVYAYRLTVEAEMDGNVYTGSNVVEIHYRRPYILCFPDCPKWWSLVRGEALAIDLGRHGLLLVPLNSSGTVGLDAPFLPSRVYAAEMRGFQKQEDRLEFLATRLETRPFEIDWLPTLWFLPDPNNLDSLVCGRPPGPFQLGNGRIGPVVIGATFEMVKQPPTPLAEKYLPWLALPEEQVNMKMARLNDALQKRVRNSDCWIKLNTFKGELGG